MICMQVLFEPEVSTQIRAAVAAAAGLLSERSVFFIRLKLLGWGELCL